MLKISVRLKHTYASYSNFRQVCKKKKNEDFFDSLNARISRNWCHLDQASQSYGCMKIAIAVPVNTFTPFAHALFSGPHDTLLCVVIFCRLSIFLGQNALNYR